MTIHRCEVCHVSWYEGEPAKHVMGCTTASEENRAILKAMTDAGFKDDKTKPLVLRGFLHQFPRAIEEVARVSEFGANKYTWNGWETVDGGVERYGEALARHLLKHGDDPESWRLHAAHAAWNAMARLELMLRGN